MSLNLLSGILRFKQAVIGIFGEFNNTPFSISKSSHKSCFSFAREFPQVCSSVCAETLLKRIYKPDVDNYLPRHIYLFLRTTNHLNKLDVCIIYVIAIWCSAANVANRITEILISCSGSLFAIFNPDKNISLISYYLHL